MNEHNIIQQQLNREDQQRKTAFKKWQKDLKEQTQRSDGSNTDYARHWKRHTFSNLLEGLQNEIDDPNKYVRSSRATDAIRRCLGTQLVHKKNKDNGTEELLIKQRKNFFNLEVCSFIAYQITLDNSMAPRNEYPTLKDLMKEQGLSTDLADYWDKECELNPSNPRCLVYED